MLLIAELRAFEKLGREFAAFAAELCTYGLLMRYSEGWICLCTCRRMFIVILICPGMPQPDAGFCSMAGMPQQARSAQIGCDCLLD